MLSAVSAIAQKLSQVVMNPAASVTAGSFDPSSVTFKDSDRDLATLSNYLKIHTKHISLDWAIDWEKQLISGKVEIELKSVHDAAVDEIILDTSYLKFDKIETKGDELKVCACDLGRAKSCSGLWQSVKPLWDKHSRSSSASTRLRLAR
jgi:hypothetical protein